MWDCFNGLFRYSDAINNFYNIADEDEQLSRKTLNIAGLMTYLYENISTDSSPMIVFIRNFQLVNKASYGNVVQSVCSLKEFQNNKNNKIKLIFISGSIHIEPEQEKMFTTFQYDLPDEEEIQNITIRFGEALKKKKNINIDKNTILRVSKAAKGLTSDEIMNCYRKSIIKYNTLDIEMVKNEKIQIVQNSGCLDFKKTTNVSVDDMGGNENFKEWIKEIQECMNPDAIKFGVVPAKGFVGFGVPGSGKTFSAEIIANLLDVPLLSLNFSKIMGSLVGQSERAIDKALAVVKACAPCVLLVDESDKTLSGYK
jgi:AAA+ superfamily predicted ATPase